MIKLIAGIDVAYYTKDNKEYGVCVIDVFDYATFNLVERQISVQKINYPYIPGSLYKRELPIIIDTYKKLNNKIDVYLLDGNGYLHQNHEGIATMFSTYSPALTRKSVDHFCAWSVRSDAVALACSIISVA